MNFWNQQKQPLNQQQSKLFAKTMIATTIQVTLFVALMIGLTFLLKYGWATNFIPTIIGFASVGGVSLIGVLIMFLMKRFKPEKYELNFAFNIIYGIFMMIVYSVVIAFIAGALEFYTFLVMIGISLVLFITLSIIGYFVSKKTVIVLYTITRVIIGIASVLMILSFVLYFVAFKNQTVFKTVSWIDLIISIIFVITFSISVVMRMNDLRSITEDNQNLEHKGLIMYLSNTMFYAYAQVLLWLLILLIRLRWIARFFGR
ncbi:hypothetical protein OF377_03015 [Ureaplasma sp. ES3154-GEN]|uniref:hypothetical protein n=1 Tax=Ureaplasma sp. ES3154-GEN TaxID=2984844 RepID=UPI0021E99F94|nr:hypothetical protein [Ureaplasma sp. ES3154-GEN]MCV3743831.1 hypothetical protein [Ureaplasma sp. ES3154-GEN]